MPWTAKQKQLAVRACKAAGISDEQRVDMILRNFHHAKVGAIVTSTSPKLTNGDFEAFMEIVEQFAGGKILHFTQDYWRNCAADGLSRMRSKARRVATELEKAGKLYANGVGLAGWIQKRVSAGTATKIEELDYHGLLALILQLEAFARQNGVELLSPTPTRPSSPAWIAGDSVVHGGTIEPDPNPITDDIPF